ncbi:MAG: hypothetical protein R8K48_06435 [Gallionella sp.]
MILWNVGRPMPQLNTPRSKVARVFRVRREARGLQATGRIFQAA